MRDLDNQPDIHIMNQRHKEIRRGMESLLGKFFQDHQDQVSSAVRESNRMVSYVLYPQPDEPMSPIPERGIVIIPSNPLNPAASKSFEIIAFGDSHFREGDSGNRWGVFTPQELSDATLAAWNALE